MKSIQFLEDPTLGAIQGTSSNLLHIRQQFSKKSIANYCLHLENADGVNFSHCSEAVVVYNRLKLMVVDNSSPINILFGTTFDKMIIDYKLTPIITPL